MTQVTVANSGTSRRQAARELRLFGRFGKED